MSFAQLNLDPNISKAIDSCGYTKPTPIQARCIPDIINGKDVVASAPTGTGKTAAFVLPSLHRLSLRQHDNKQDSPHQKKAKPRILILTPTRELASQITQTAMTYGKFMHFKIISLVGGMSYYQQIRNLSKPVDIVVATPGRLLDHLRSHRLDLSKVETLIFDEADRMLDMGFIDDVKAIAKTTPKERQTLLFSATVDGKLNKVIQELMKNPVRIDLSEQALAPAKIRQELYLTDNEQHKGRLLRHFMSDKNIFKAIIFTATKINADKLARTLRDQNFSAAALHGDLKQNVRTRTLDQLRQGKIQYLVATDVAARGIDVSDITHVINYDLPKFSEDYVHRIGRTGRAGRSGIAISFALPSEGRNIRQIERYLGQSILQSTVDGLEPSKRLQQTAKPAGNSRFSKDKSFGKKKSFSKGKPFSKSSTDQSKKKRFWFKDPQKH